jgi:lactobin A/cerein 7B family class IIb bacteriocin
MKNLEKFGVQELNTAELKDVDGGIIPFILARLVLWGSIAPYYITASK